MTMAKLTMTRIVQDIDSLDLLNYANASDRRAFLLDYCREHFHSVHIALYHRVAGAFREAIGPSVSYGGSGLRSTIGVETLY